MAFLLLFLSAFEDKEALADIVEGHEEAHTGEHRHVLLQSHACAGEYPAGERLCAAVGKQIAEGDVHNEAGNGLARVLLAFEGEVLIEEIAQHAGESAGNGGAPPHIQVGEIDEQKGQSGVGGGIEQADENEFQ